MEQVHRIGENVARRVVQWPTKKSFNPLYETDCSLRFLSRLVDSVWLSLSRATRSSPPRFCRNVNVIAVSRRRKVNISLINREANRSYVSMASRIETGKGGNKKQETRNELQFTKRSTITTWNSRWETQRKRKRRRRRRRRKGSRKKIIVPSGLFLINFQAPWPAGFPSLTRKKNLFPRLYKFSASFQLDLLYSLYLRAAFSPSVSRRVSLSLSLSLSLSIFSSSFLSRCFIPPANERTRGYVRRGKVSPIRARRGSSLRKFEAHRTVDVREGARVGSSFFIVYRGKNETRELNGTINYRRQLRPASKHFVGELCLALAKLDRAIKSLHSLVFRLRPTSTTFDRSR